MRTILSFLVIVIFFTVELTANNGIQDIMIENVEFPEFVDIGDIVIFKCDIVNTSNSSITIDFDLNFNLTTSNNDYSEVDEIETFDNATIESGESMSVERPIYINSTRATSNSNNLLATWPTARDGESGTPSESNFYVADDGANGADGHDGVVDLERGEEAIYNECDIEITPKNNQVVINGLSSEFETSIIDQDGIINYFCKGNCPSDEVIVDLPDFGFFFIQVRSLIDQQCISFNSIVIGDWSTYQLEYDLNDIFYIPPGAFYDFENAIQLEINEVQTRLDTVQFQIDTLQSQIDSLQFQIDDLNAQLLQFANNVPQAQVDYMQSGIDYYESVLDYMQSGLEQRESIKEYYLSEIEYLESIIDELNSNTTDADCAYAELEFTPLVNNILETTALVSIADLYNDVNCEIKESSSDEWKLLSLTNGIAVLSQLKACTSYDVRSAYNCNIGKVVSNIVTFETGGCEISCGEELQLYELASLGFGVVLNWDFSPGQVYQLKYKATNENEWKTYDTRTSMALLFGLKTCSNYEFKVSVICEDKQLGVESNIITIETGNCKIGSALIHDKTFAVYPTVTNNYIGIIANDIENISELNIYNLAGNLVKTINPQIMTISVSDLPNGTYVVTAITSNSVLSAKFMKQ